MTRDRIHTLAIRTPEGIEFSLWLAGPVSRFLALAVDFACVTVLSSLAGTMLGVLGAISEDLAGSASILAYFILSTGYGIALEWFWRGQTLGKRLLGLRVMDAQGLRLQPSQVVIRNLLRFVDFLPGFYLVGGLACLLSRRAQRLGDVAANTIVVRRPRVAEPDLDQVLAGKFNSFRGHPHLAARLRQRVSPHEAAIALQALVRRDAFEPRARVELFCDLASHFREQAAFPPEATEGLTDEQYVRNVVDVVYRARPRGNDANDK